MDVDIDLVKPSPYQPRLDFSLEDLKGSILKDGIASPLIVRHMDTRYELIDGQRRLMLAKQLDYKTVPCQVIEADNEKAMRLVWRLNVERKDYTPKEKAYHFRNCQKQGMSLREIGRLFGYSPQDILMYVNVFKLPQEYEEAVWHGSIPIGNIRELEALFSGVTRATPEIINWLDQRLPSADLRKALSPTLARFKEQQIQKAQEAVGEIAPEITLETPEDYERAADALKKEAKRKAEEAMTPEERATLVAQKEQDAIERDRKGKEAQQRRAEARKREIEEQARKQAQEIIKDTNFVREFVAGEYVLTDDVSTEDLREALMHKLMANIPEGKRERAKDIFDEEFNSLQKRLEIFPEKSMKIEPKFTKFKELVTRGVIPYTVWDFPHRDDYAGDKDFHGNCSPQIVEQCIWRLTEEGDLVLDPMAGSGTALDVCRQFNRRYIGYDIKPPADREDITQNDSRSIPLEDTSVDMVFIHPPYWNLVHFAKAEEKLPDLSRATTATQFLEMLKEVFRECHRVLKGGKFMCVLLGDLIRDGSFVPLCRGVANLATEIGFTDYGYAVKLAHGEVSRKKSGVIVAEPLYTNNLKISHDLVLFLRKGES